MKPILLTLFSVIYSCLAFAQFDSKKLEGELYKDCDIKLIFLDVVAPAPTAKSNAESTVYQPKVEQKGLLADRISPDGNPTVFLENAYWATWFANGTRNINVGINEKIINELVEISPNPASDALTIKLVPAAGKLQSYAPLDASGRTVRRVGVNQHLDSHQINIATIPLETI